MYKSCGSKKLYRLFSLMHPIKSVRNSKINEGTCCGVNSSYNIKNCDTSKEYCGKNP